MIAGAGVFAYAQCWLTAWMPNVVVGALTVALTITVIDRAFRREAQRRLKPRVDDALWRIGSNFRSLVFGVAIDYAATHVDNFKPIPADASAMMAHWLANADDANSASLGAAGEEPLLIQEAESFVEPLEIIRERDREVLEPDLVRAMDEDTAAVRQSRMLIRMPYAPPANQPTNEQVAVRSVVVAAGQFIDVFGRYAPGSTEIRPQLRHAARAHNEQVRRMRDQSAGATPPSAGES